MSTAVTTSTPPDSTIDPWQIPLEAVDVSDPLLYEQDTWRPYFERLRNEAPVHYQKQSPFGPFWSVTRFEDIVYVDTHHDLFSSEPVIVIGDVTEDLPVEMFIAMDPPKHDQQRAAVQPVVAPKNLAEMEGLIRQRVVGILDSLPVGETFDWVPRVSIEPDHPDAGDPVQLPLRRTLQAHLLVRPGHGSPGNRRWHHRSRRALRGSAGLPADLNPHLVRAAGAEPHRGALQLRPDQPACSPARIPGICRSRPMEFLGNLILLIVGGNDTTRNSISGGVLALNQFPQEYDKLRADHSPDPRAWSRRSSAGRRPWRTCAALPHRTWNWAGKPSGQATR